MRHNENTVSQMSTTDTIKIQPIVKKTTHRIITIVAAHAGATFGEVIDGWAEAAAKKMKLDGRA